MPQPAPSCRLTSIQIHLNPQRVPEDGLTEKAGSRSGEVGAPGDMRYFHPVSQYHLFLCGHVPVTGCTLSEHSELPRGGELVSHMTNHTVRGKESTCFNSHACIHNSQALQRQVGGPGVWLGGVALWGEGLSSVCETLGFISSTPLLAGCDDAHLWSSTQRREEEG